MSSKWVAVLQVRQVVLEEHVRQPGTALLQREHWSMALRKLPALQAVQLVAEEQLVHEAITVEQVTHTLGLSV